MFDYIIADMVSNKKLNPIVTELFVKEKKLNTSLVFITQSYFAVPKNNRLNSRHYLRRIERLNKSFNKLHIIIHQILTFETL